MTTDLYSSQSAVKLVSHRENVFTKHDTRSPIIIIIIIINIIIISIIIIIIIIINKGKVHPGTGHEGPEGE